MTYKLLHITTLYRGVIDYLDRRQYEHLDYSQHSMVVFKEKVGLSDRYSHYLPEFGAEGVEVIANYKSLQMKWAKENDLKVDDNDWFRKILLTQIGLIQPDIIFFSELYSFDRSLRDRIQEICKHRVKLVGWRFSQTSDLREFEGLDMLFTGNEYFASQYKHALPTRVIALGFDERIVEGLSIDKEEYDFTFAGTLGRPEGVHSERFNLVRSLLESGKLHVWTSGVHHSWKTRSLAKAFNVASLFGLRRYVNTVTDLFRLIQDDLVLRFIDFMHEPVYGLAYYSVLKQSKVSLNKHIDVASTSSGNVRMFEATGLGSCLLTDYKSDIENYFIPDEEVVCYRSKEEAMDKAGMLLKDNELRRKISDAGMKKTLSNFTARSHVAKADAALAELLSGKVI